ncbi:MAG: NusA-like transcription termination signal-binding factor [Candidatus Aenigmatarchaeota archaeon]|nr:MAG: NusA-like transcription termination signal-binding factor [Candidatus Aenigmarchaeota archaeon]
MTVKLSTDSIRIIALFEKVTNVHAKDCIINDKEIYFVVGKDKVGRAIGKNGSKMKDLRRMLAGRHVKIFAYGDNLEDSVKSMIPNASKVEIKDDSVFVSVPGNEKVSVIGKNGRNINAIREILKRQFDVKKLKLL